MTTSPPVIQPSERHRPQWHTLLLMSVPLVCYLLTTLLIHNLTDSPALASAGGALVVIATYPPCTRLHRLSRPAARTYRYEVPWTWWVIAFVIVWLACQFTTVYVYSNWSWAAIAYDQRMASVAAGTPAVWLVLSLLLAPVAEEMLMRGLLYRSLRQVLHLPILTSVLLSATFFAALHVNAVLTPATFLLGLLLALVYERTRSLWAPIGLHLLFNLLAQVVPAAAVASLVSPVSVTVLVVLAIMVLWALLHAVQQSQQRVGQLTK